MLDSCKYRYWSKGCRQPRDPGMPEFMWGQYLPGDEPGEMCRLTGDYCAGTIEGCELWNKSEKLCPECESQLFTDGEIFFCIYCGSEMLPEEAA